MISGIGWSAGDIADSCEVILCIIEALSDAKGIPKQYRDSHAFLCGIVSVINYVSNEARAATLPENARVQIQIISNSYLDLHTYVVKYANISSAEDTRLKTVLPTVRWNLNELDGKVQTMKNSSSNAIEIMETLIIIDLNSRVNDLVAMADRNEQSVNMATTILCDVREQQASLSQMSEQYEILLNDLKQDQSSPSAEIVYVEARLQNISKAQRNLETDLDNLTRYLEEGVKHDQWQGQQWQTLLNSQPQPSIHSRNLDQTQKSLRNTGQLLGGMGNMTGNRQMQHTAGKINGVNRVFGALSPISSRIGGKFRGSAKDGDIQVASAAIAPSPPNRTSTYSQPKKTFKPAPPVTTPPPPRRQSVPLAPVQPSSRNNALHQPQKRNLPVKSSVLPNQSLEPRGRVGPSLGGTSPSADLSLILPGDAQRSPPALPPRRISAPLPMIENSAGKDNDRPPLPARPRARDDSLALMLVETCPPLPARNYKLSESTALTTIEPPLPMLPPRSYRNSMPPMTKASVNKTMFPQSQPQLTTTSSPLQYTPIAKKPNIERVISNSSTASSNSTQTLDSIKSTVSSVSTAPSATSEASENLGFAELRKKFEARSAAAAPDFGKQFQKVM